jgi:hypothetical protein
VCKLSWYFCSLILIFAFVLIYYMYVKKTMPVQTFSIMWSLPFISLHCIIFLIKINLIFWMQAWYPEPSDVQLLSTWHMTKVHLLQKFLDHQKHALIDNILPTCGNLSRFSFTWKMCVLKVKCVSTFIKGKMTRGLQGN